VSAKDVFESVTEVIDSEFDSEDGIHDLLQVMLEKNKARLKDKYESRVARRIKSILTLSKEVDDEEPF
jgi:hypothetical protein